MGQPDPYDAHARASASVRASASASECHQPKCKGIRVRHMGMYEDCIGVHLGSLRGWWQATQFAIANINVKRRSEIDERKREASETLTITLCLSFDVPFSGPCLDQHQPILKMVSV